MTARIWLLASALLSSTGCVNMSGLDGGSKYACAAPDGVTCDSVSGTYANALQHNLPSQQAAAPSAQPSRGSAAATPAPTSMATCLPGARLTAPEASTPLRSPARILRLWTKPWEDADGDLWDQGFVYVQVESGRWQLDHVRQRIRDAYTPLRPPPNAAVGTGQATPGDAASPPPPADDSSAPRPAGMPFNPFPALTRQPLAQPNRP